MGPICGPGRGQECPRHLIITAGYPLDAKARWKDIQRLTVFGNCAPRESHSALME